MGVETPRRRLHNLVAKILLPNYSMEEIDRINREIDSAWKIFGRKHREIFGHKLNLPTLIYLLDDPRRIPVWIIHVALDNFFSEIKGRRRRSSKRRSRR